MKSVEVATRDAPRKRRKLEEFGGLSASHEQWSAFHRDVLDFESSHVIGNSKAVFHFVEGPLVKALREGDWYAASW